MRFVQSDSTIADTEMVLGGDIILAVQGVPLAKLNAQKRMDI